MTDHNDDDHRWLETVLKGLDERSEAVKQALMRAVAGREGAGPLLGLEPRRRAPSSSGHHPIEIVG